MAEGVHSLFEPTAEAFVKYVVGFCFRYALICGGIYLFFHVWGRLRRFKIQPDEPVSGRIRHEIGWSFSNTICTGLFSLLMYWMIQQGYTRMYYNIDDYGWGWFLLSIPLGTVGFDAWFYWMHRALHTPWLFRHCHSVHHRSENPTAFAAFAHHPIETLWEDTYFLLFILVVPVHPLAFGLIGLHAFTLGVLGHFGFEFFPRGFTRHAIFGLHNTSTHHNMHHSHMGGNYSLYFNWWDRIMGTNHPGYHDHFEAIKERQRVLAAKNADTASMTRS